MDVKKGGLILLVGIAISKIGSIIFRLILVNRLDPLIYGKFSIFLIMFNWLLMISTLNIGIGLAKFVSEKKIDRNLHYMSGLLGCINISLIVSVVLILLATEISNFININDPSIILFLALTMPLAVVYNLTIFYLRGQYKMKSSVISDTLLTTVRVLLLLVLLYLGYRYMEYTAFLFSFVVLDVVLLFLIRPRLKDLSRIKQSFKKLLFYSLPIFISESSTFFARGLDRMFLGKFYTTYAAGIYDMGVMLCIGYLVIAISFANALLPVASRNQENRKSLKKNLTKTLKYVLGLYVLYSIGVLLIAKPLILLINPAYITALEFLLPLMLSYACIGIFILLSFFVNAIRLQKYAVVSSLLFAIMCFGLNFYLVPKLKYLGAVNALLISSISSIILITILIWRGLRSRS